MLARKGRKRRSGVTRYENGAIVRSERKPREDIMGVVKAQRLRLVKEAHVTDQKAESPLGVFLLRGWLNAPGDAVPHNGTGRLYSDNAETRYRAGLEYARVVAANRRDLDSPSEDARNRVLANMQPGDARGVAPELLYTPDQLRAKADERRRRYQAAYEALRQQSIWAFDAVYTVAIREKGIVPEKLGKLREGLDALAVHFRLKRGA